VKKEILSSVNPFEICSIRPPTENNSLTFRLTRNCYWKKCGFCPVYKTDIPFKKRLIEEIKSDIKSARILDDLLCDTGAGVPAYSEADYIKGDHLAEKIKTAKMEAGIVNRGRVLSADKCSDPRMQWFSRWFIDYPDISDCINHILSWRIDGGKNCFLGDADLLILKPEFMQEVIDNIRENFPGIKRFTVYGRTKTAAKQRSLQDLTAYKNSGLDRVHFGIESGSAAVLEMINKGETPDDHIQGALKASEAGLSCSFYVMPGLGGQSLSAEHAIETARVINEARPDFVRLRTLEIFNGTPLDEMRKSGTFIEADDDMIALEIRSMLEAINVPVQILSDSATNLLPLYGCLSQEKESMLAVIDKYLSLDRRRRLEISFMARLESFYGQYGTLSPEIIGAIGSVIKGSSIDFENTSDEDIIKMTAFIKSRLMP
jgi:radical SAM superfamily enzyme YgiQ (UPF0313 family)